ncbi:MAG: hypothetical protein O3B24_01590 [Verrucomicrobia bacterium]|nr:hypothetical protein [Verrucomicrobiota bacterium]
MKTKNGNTAQSDGDKRPPPSVGFWVTPEERKSGDTRAAQRRAWMTPNEFSRWQAPPHGKVQDDIEREAHKTMQTERKAEASAREARRQAERMKAEVEARRMADRKRDVEDAILSMAADAASNKVKRQHRGRIYGKDGAPTPRDGDKIPLAVAAVEKSIRRGGKMQSACTYNIGIYKLTIKWPALAKHVRKHALAKKRRV